MIGRILAIISALTEKERNRRNAAGKLTEEN
jgi:hypothetical protein